MKKLILIISFSLMAGITPFLTMGCTNDAPKGVVSPETAEEFNQLIASEKPVLVDFYADWCKPCRIQGPIVVEIASEMGKKIIVVKLDVDKLPAIAGDYKVQGIPTLMIFQNGKEKWKAVGLRQKEEIIKNLNASL